MTSAAIHFEDEAISIWVPSDGYPDEIVPMLTNIVKDVETQKKSICELILDFIRDGYPVYEHDRYINYEYKLMRRNGKYVIQVNTENEMYYVDIE